MNFRPANLAVAAILATLLLLAGCNSSPVKPASQTPSTPSPSVTSIAPPPSYPQWNAFLSTYDRAIAYYGTYGRWGKPATQDQDELTEAQLAADLKDLAKLVPQGHLSPEELSLIRQEVEDIDRWGGNRSRNVIMRDGAEVHSDSFTLMGEGACAYEELQTRLPLLTAVARQPKHNQQVTRWLLARIRTRADILADLNVARETDTWTHLLDGWDRRNEPRESAQELRKRIMDLISKIEQRSAAS